MQALSAVGRCRSFDASGDGYGRGEGFAVAVLLPATPGSNAQQAPALAVVLATAVNQDGRSSSMTAPNGPSQSTLIQTALHVGRLRVNQVPLPPIKSCLTLERFFALFLFSVQTHKSNHCFALSLVQAHQNKHCFVFSFLLAH